MYILILTISVLLKAAKVISNVCYALDHIAARRKEHAWPQLAKTLMPQITQRQAAVLLITLAAFKGIQ